MKSFTTKPGVDAFQTQGPHGILLVEAGSPLLTEDPAEISILESAGAHALDSEELDGETAGSGLTDPPDPQGQPDHEVDEGGERS